MLAKINAVESYLTSSCNHLESFICGGILTLAIAMQPAMLQSIQSAEEERLLSKSEAPASSKKRWKKGHHHHEYIYGVHSWRRFRRIPLHANGQETRLMSENRRQSCEQLDDMQQQRGRSQYYDIPWISSTPIARLITPSKDRKYKTLVNTNDILNKILRFYLKSVTRYVWVVRCTRYAYKSRQIETKSLEKVMQNWSGSSLRENTFFLFLGESYRASTTLSYLPITGSSLRPLSLMTRGTKFTVDVLEGRASEQLSGFISCVVDYVCNVDISGPICPHGEYSQILYSKCKLLAPASEREHQ